MDIFQALKASIKTSVEKLRGTPSLAEIVQVVNASGDWDSLENKLYELRTISRKRQQEILDRLEPLAERVEELVAGAKKARFKIKRQNLLRQAADLMRELEAEDEPAKLYSANGQMLTDLIMQVRRARAMSERGIDSMAIDQVGAQLEQVVIQYQDVLDATTDFDTGVELTDAQGTPETEQLERRLKSVYADGLEDEPGDKGARESDRSLLVLEERLYPSKARGTTLPSERA